MPAANTTSAAISDNIQQPHTRPSLSVANTSSPAHTIDGDSNTVINATVSHTDDASREPQTPTRVCQPTPTSSCGTSDLGQRSPMSSRGTIDLDSPDEAWGLSTEFREGPPLWDKHQGEMRPINNESSGRRHESPSERHPATFEPVVAVARGAVVGVIPPISTNASGQSSSDASPSTTNGSTTQGLVAMSGNDATNKSGDVVPKEEDDVASSRRLSEVRTKALVYATD